MEETGRAAQDKVGPRLLDLQTVLCCSYGCIALATRKRKHYCLVEAEGWHLQSMLGVSSMEGCVYSLSKTNWSKAGDCLGQSQERDLAASISQKEAGKLHDCSW